jgi:predicted regulator of Ras-like GTPase activity (Roadblock/LC7/MglB family)
METTMTQSWMLSEITGVRGVRHALVLSADGLPTKTRSAGLGQETADKVAAACSGLHSLGQGVAQEFGVAASPEADPALRQLLIEYDGGFLFLRAAGEGSRLAVVTDAEVDPGELAQQMQAQILKIGQPTLSTPARPDTST